jgi:tetratricopeptide (TPR) repeat protein
MGNKGRLSVLDPMRSPSANDGGISPDQHRSYALGYLALDMAAQARAELAFLKPDDFHALDSLSLRVDIGMALKEWTLVVDDGREYAERRPRDEKGWICWAYALRELQRVRDAHGVLIRAEPLHGKSCAVLHYNLGCYHCLLGDKVEARRRLEIAFLMSPSLQEDAKNDPDLESL